MQAQKQEQEALDQAKKTMLESMQQSYSEMNDKMFEINKMIAELQAQAEASKSEREQYDQENGITDGQERMNKAIEDARLRHQQNQERLGIVKPEDSTVESDTNDSLSSSSESNQQDDFSQTEEPE